MHSLMAANLPKILQTCMNVWVKQQQGVNVLIK